MALALMLVSGVLVVPAAGQAAEPIRVCQHIPITGAAAVDRDPDKFGGFYFDYVNAELDGIGGRPVDFVTFDDRFNPPFAVQAAERCLSLGADLYLGPMGRDQIVAVAKWAQRNGVPYLHGSAGAADLEPYKTSAFFGPADEVQAAGLADILVANMDSLVGPIPPVFGMVRMSSPFYMRAHDAFKARLEELGHTLAVDREVHKDENSFTSMWAELQSERVSIFVNLTTPLHWLRMAKQRPASYHPIWTSLAPEFGWSEVAAFIAPEKAVVLHEPSPVYDEEDPDLAWAGEIMRFRDVFDRYASSEVKAPRDDIDWMSYLRAKRIHRLLLALDGDYSAAHVNEVLAAWSETEDEAFPSCALDFRDTPRIGAHAWHVFASPGDGWRQAGFCVVAGGPPPTIDFAPPGIACGPAVQTVTGPFRCTITDPAGVEGYSISVQQPPLAAEGRAGTGGCAPSVEVDFDVPVGPSLVAVHASDCAGNATDARFIVVRTPLL